MSVVHLLGLLTLLVLPSPIGCTRRTEPRGVVDDGGTGNATMPIHPSCAALSKGGEAPLPRFAATLPLKRGGTVWVLAAATVQPFERVLQAFAERKPFYTLCGGQRGVVVVPGAESEAEIGSFERLLLSSLPGTTVIERATVHAPEAEAYCKDHPCASLP